MGRKKNQVYIGYNARSRKVSTEVSQVATTKSGLNSNAPLRRHSIKVVPLIAGLSNSKSGRSPVKTPNTRRKFLGRVHKLRTSLKFLATASAVLSWLIALIGHTIVHTFDPRLTTSELLKDCLKLSVFGLSLVQIVLIVSYWRVSLVYAGALQNALHRERFPRARGPPPPWMVFLCGVECCLHLVAPMPNYAFEFSYVVFGKENRLSVDDVLYLFLLLRNYHSLRALFWMSPVSDLRTRIFTEVRPIPFSTGFVFRFFLAQFGLQLILGIYGVLVLIPGAVQYILEQSGLAENCMIEWDNFWVVATTQLTIGYGDKHPITFPGQVAIVVTCFFGVFTLGMINSIFSAKCSLTLTECSLYSSLLYSHEKSKYELSAVLLLQSWWRLMLMRMKKTRKVSVILEFYSVLRNYRGVLVTCQRVKDTMPERQIQAFEDSVRSKIRPLNEYLRPVIDAQTMVRPTLDPRRAP